MKFFSSRHIFTIIIVIFSLTGILFRLYDLQIDPFPAEQFGAGWADEASYAHNARNKSLFNQWVLPHDHWNPVFVSPLHTWLTFISFHQFGQTLLTLRTMTAAVSLVSIILASFSMWKKNSQLAAVFFILCVTNSFLIAFARIATLEYLIISMLFVILGCLLSKEWWGWTIAGVLTPLLLVTKITTLPYVLALPTALVGYRICNKKSFSFRSKFFNYFWGFGVSLILLGLLFWQFHEPWLAMNFTGYSNRIGVSPGKSLAVFSHYTKYLYLIGVIPVLGLISFGYRMIQTSWRKWGWVDWLLLTIFVSFGSYTLLADYQLRRIVTITPFLLLLTAREVTHWQKLKIQLNQQWITINKKLLLSFVLTVYAVWNLFPVALHFNRGLIEGERAHRFVHTTTLLQTEVLPQNAVVYGNWGSALAVGAEYQSFFSYPNIEYANRDDDMLPLLESGKITHAVFPYDLHNQADRAYYGMNYPESSVWKYFDQHFELQARLPFKYHKYNNDQTFLYVYERKK